MPLPQNGMVRAVIVADGRVAGIWTPAEGAAGIELFGDPRLTEDRAARAAVAAFTEFPVGMTRADAYSAGEWRSRKA